MQLSTTNLLLLISSSISLVSANGNLLCCDSTSCGQGSCSTQDAPPPANGDGACISLGGIKSVQATNIDAGCSFTIYADPTCSTNPLAVGLSDCFSFDGGIQSYSYDC